jgi:hypothetical protein
MVRMVSLWCLGMDSACWTSFWKETGLKWLENHFIFDFMPLFQGFSGVRMVRALCGRMVRVCWKSFWKETMME